MARALIVVDVQNDFCEGGSLPVTGGARVAAGIHDLLQRWHSHADDRPAYDVVVATKDHHVDPGHHWSVKPDFAESWPVHCKVGSEGAGFHPNQAAYSGFEGRTATGEPLADWLRARNVVEVDVCGIATDHCVRATALDSAQEGFTTRVLTALCAGVAEETTAAAITAMSSAGVQIA